MKLNFILLLTLTLLLTSVGTTAIYDDCEVYGNCEDVVAEDVNYSLVPTVNNSLYWQGYTGTDGTWLTGLVPYTGAVSNVDLGSNTITTTNTGRFDGGIIDSSLNMIIDTENHCIIDNSNNNAIDWESRILYANDGIDSVLNWASAGTADFGDSAITTTGLLTASNIYSVATDNGFLFGAGNSVLTGDWNIGIGENVLASLTTGNENVGVGTNALNALTEGHYNFGLGRSSLLRLTTGSGNVAIGREPLPWITTGDNNIGIGRNAGVLLPTSSGSNILIGSYAFDAVAGISSGNTIIGRSAATTATTSGNFNTVIGLNALDSPTTIGTQNTVIGASAGQSPATFGNRNILIGYSAGRDETGSDVLMIDNRDRTTEALGRTNSIIYGIMAAAPTDQTLTFNANTKVNGNLNVTGNITGNQIYGGMWYTNYTATELNFAVDGQFYQLFMQNATHLNGFGVEGLGHIGSASNLTTQVAGVYQANYMATGDGQNNHEYHTSIFINGVNQMNCDTQHKLAAGGDILTQTGTCLIRLNVGDKISLKTADVGSTGTGNYYGANLDLVRIGD